MYQHPTGYRQSQRIKAARILKGKRRPWKIIKKKSFAYSECRHVECLYTNFHTHLCYTVSQSKREAAAGKIVSYNKHGPSKSLWWEWESKDLHPADDAFAGFCIPQTGLLPACPFDLCAYQVLYKRRIPVEVLRGSPLSNSTPLSSPSPQILCVRHQYFLLLQLNNKHDLFIQRTW